MRKSPIKHTVRAHTRDSGDTKVKSYVSGNGLKLKLSTQNPPYWKAHRKIHDMSEMREGIICDKDKEMKPEHCDKCNKEKFATSHELRKYVITFAYVDGKHETVQTVSHSPKEALHNSNNLRKSYERPVAVVVENGFLESVGHSVGGLFSSIGKLGRSFEDLINIYAK